MCFLFLGTATILAETEEEILKSRESWVKIVDVEGRSLLVYAQNSPEWADLYMTENIKTNRRFGEAGCAVTALANATVNLIPMERLKAITEIMQSPVAFDSVNFHIIILVFSCACRRADTVPSGRHSHHV